jgi:hypothetical protein
MAYDAIRDTHSSRSPSTTPVLDTHYPFPPGQSMNAPGRNGASPHYQEMSSPYERQPYPGQFERQASSRPGSSGGLRGLLNDEEEPGIFPERRSSGSTQGQIPSHRREYRHPSIGSVLGGAGSPGSMGEGRSLSMLLNGPTTLATPSSTTAMTPGMTPSHYPSPSPLGSNIRSPRFAVPTSAGGQTREYPFPPTPSGSSQHTSRPSPALYGLYNPQKSPTYRSRPLPPTAMDSQTGFPLSGYRPPSRGAPGKAPSPSPSVTSIHNLISPTSENKPYRSPSTEARSLYGMSMVGQPQTRTGTPSDSYSHTNSMPISRSTSGGLLLDPDSRDYTRQSSVHMEGPVSISPDRERERPERRSSIMGWTGEPSMSMSIPMSTSIPSRSFNLSGLISPSNELEPPSQDVRHRSRRLSVIDLASPSQNPIPLESSSNNKEINRAHTVAETNNENAMMDVDIPDGASALDVLASLSERAGSSRIREDDIQRKQKRESVSGVEVEEVKVAEKTEAPVSITVPSPRVEKKDEDMQADVDGDESSDQVPAEVLRNRKIESEMTPEQKEQQELVVQVAPQEVASSERDQPESTVDQPESIVDRPQTSFKPKPSQPPSPLAESMALSPSARAASPFAQDENDQTTPRQTTPIDLAAQIFPADEKPEPLPAPVAIPEPAAIPVHSGKTEYKPRRLTAPLSVLQPLSAEDMAWYSDARNCLNPLRRGCPFKTMAEGKQRLSGPPGGEGASSSLNGLKRARDSPYTNGDDKQEQDNGWALKRARRGPVEALNEQSEVAAHCKRVSQNIQMKLCTENQFAHLSDNARGNTGRAARTQSATYGLKTCNNWIKSVLIARFTRRRPGVSDFDPEDRSLRPNGRVLDMGCGKGGDIDKWNRAKIEEYVGIGKQKSQSPWSQRNTSLS